MKYLWQLIITVVLSIFGSYLAISLVLNFPLSGPNTIFALMAGVIAGLILFLPVFVILYLHIKHALIWITLVNLIGFALIVYFVYGFAATIASV